LSKIIKKCFKTGVCKRIAKRGKFHSLKRDYGFRAAIHGNTFHLVRKMEISEHLRAAANGEFCAAQRLRRVGKTS
jgi:hypothetical protein